MTPSAATAVAPAAEPKIVPGRIADGRAAPAATAGAKRTRLLLEGSIVSTLLRLAAPNVVVNVVLIAVTASVDAYFVGKLGPSALAGLSLVFPLLMLMQQVANASMGGAIASAIARSIGSGRRDDASSLVVHGLLIAGGMAALFTALVLAGGPTIYALMGGRGEVLAAAVEYSAAIFGGALVYWLLSALTSVVRGTGQPTVLAFVYIGAELLHIALVPVLVFGVGPLPALGITGAGLATVTSFGVSTGVLAWYVASGRTALTLSLHRVQLQRRLFTEILRVGAPMSLQPILNNLALATMTAFASTLGPTALAGFGVAVRLEYVQYPLTFGHRPARLHVACCMDVVLQQQLRRSGVGGELPVVRRSCVPVPRAGADDGVDVSSCRPSDLAAPRHDGPRACRGGRRLAGHPRAWNRRGRARTRRRFRTGCLRGDAGDRLPCRRPEKARDVSIVPRHRRCYGVSPGSRPGARHRPDAARLPARAARTVRSPIPPLEGGP